MHTITLPPDIDLAHDLTTRFATMGTEEAEQLAHLHFGVTGRATRLATEKDDTFRIDAADGRRLILKAANPAEPRDELSFQVDLLEHLAQVDPGLPVPRVRRDLQGQALACITDRAGQLRLLRLLSYLDGTPLDSLESLPHQRADVGRMLARLRLALRGFAHHAQDRPIAWDVQHLHRLQCWLADVGDARQRDLLARGMERFLGFSARIAALRRQVLHNDFSRSNIVVDPAHADFVVGVIDFGDAVRTAVAIDVSTALLNQLPRDLDTHPVADMFAAGRSLLQGYLEVADLSDDELALLPHLTMGRVIARALITLRRAELFPHNQTYILRNTAQGWAQLTWFLARPADAVSATFLPRGA